MQRIRFFRKGEWFSRIEDSLFKSAQENRYSG